MNDLTSCVNLDRSRAFSFNEWSKYESKEDYLTGIDYRIRSAHIKHRGFPIVTTEQLDILAELLKDKRTIDIGCGTGWLSEQLINRSVVVAPVDNYVEDYKFNRYVGAIQKDILEELPHQDYEAVILSRPCYNTPFASEVAKSLKSGTFLCYQGEGFGGCTGDDAFFRILDRDFIELAEITEQLAKFQRSFCGIRDTWTIYVKRQLCLKQ